MKKLSVVIADDDRLVLKDLTSIIDWGSLGFQIVATVPSGEAALEAVRKYRPFLLITDVIMLGMNGLELIEHVRTEFPSTRFLVISSYDDFHYVKRALSSGVLDYLLKTEITPGALTEKLMQAKTVYSADHSNLALITGQNLQHYFNDGSDAFQASADWMKPLTDRQFYFFRLTIGHLFLRDTFRTGDFYYQKLSPEFQHFYELTTDFCAFPIVSYYKDSLIIGLSCDKGADSYSSWTLNDFRYKALKWMNHHGIPALMFFAPSPLSLQQFKFLLQSTDRQVQYLSYFYEDFPQNLEQLKELTVVSLAKPFPLHSLLLNEEQEEHNILQLKDYLDRLIASRDMEQLIRFYQSFCFYLETASGNQLEIAGQLHAPTPEYFEKWVFNSLHECTSILAHGLAHEYSPVVEQAIRFMESHYSNADLSAVDIADSVGLSANRLGILLKQETGRTLNEYLSQVRIDKAIQLLEKTNLKIYEIAEKCGYKSSQYFSTLVFQKTGKKPIDYRKGRK